jgi:4-carboxymuconolactone decarboxylase
MTEPQTGAISFDIAERERHVVGSGPRIASIPESEVDQSCWDIVNAIRSAIGLGPADSLPDFTRLMSKHPPLFQRQMEMGTTIFQGQIPPRERELAVLRIAWLCRAPYEWGEHIDISQRYGVTPEEIERATQGSSAPGWSKHEAALLRGVEELIADQALSDATYATLAETWSESQLIEYLMMVGQYFCTAILQNSLRATLDEGNTGLSRR